MAGGLIWREKKRSRIMAVQMDNLRGLLGIRRMAKVPNVQIRKMCRVRNGVDKRIDKGVLLWFDLVKRIENNRIVRRSM